MRDEQTAIIAHLIINREHSGEQHLVVDTGVSGLRLQKGHIYTLQGANGAGKSSLIRVIMGVPEGRGQDPIAFRVSNQNVKVNDVADAIGYGLVAVFQDDQLIPTMTVREQLLLRHGGSGFRTLIVNIIKKWLRRLPAGRGEDILSAIGLQKSNEEKILNKAIGLLRIYDAFHPEAHYTGIIEKYPKELSGGEHAVARIILSQLTSGIQVLFLDEIFRGVQREIWPRILDAIRTWAIDEHVTILAVSHNHEELARWRPHGRFEMNNRRLRALPPLKYEVLYPGLPARNPICAVFEPAIHRDWSDELNLRGPWIVLCDKAIEKSHAFTMVLDQLRGRVVFFRSLTAGEALKSLDSCISILTELSTCGNGKSLRGASLLIAGGGSLINWAGFIASVLHRGVQTVLLPSTVMSIADVAIGSKTSINISSTETTASHKHVLGTYHNPFAILLEERLLQSLPINEKHYGLSECLKHGLLQDRSLWEKALKLFRETNPNWKNCFEVARRTMELKAQVLGLDPWERSFGRILLYGHLHAHSLERISSLKVPHGLAVLFGLLVEMKLSDSAKDQYAQLLDSCRAINIFNHEELKLALSKSQTDWHSAYFSDTKDQHLQQEDICCLKFVEVGCYAEQSSDFEEHSVIKIAWDDFFPRFQSVLRDIYNFNDIAQPGASH